MAPNEQLKRARAQSGEDLAALSARTGLRVHHARAIEEGRFADLPRGIYARAAIRSFAAAYTLDVAAVLADCEPLLPHSEDPIEALARMRGIAPPAAVSSGEARQVLVTAGPPWRPFAAATLDGAVAGALLATASVAAALIARVSLPALSPSAPALFMLGVTMGAAYYVWVGGLGGTTFGEYALGPDARRRDPRPLTLRAIALRTRAAATADLRAIHGMGIRAGRRLTPDAARSAPPLAPSPSPPRSRGREEALTWSMTRRASVPPLRLRPRRD